MITVLYFASLRESLGLDRELVQEPVATVGDLRDLLSARHGENWQQAAAGRPLLVAVNQDVANDDEPVKEGDEVAFFPPVTGG